MVRKYSYESLIALRDTPGKLPQECEVPLEVSVLRVSQPILKKKVKPHPAKIRSDFFSIDERAKLEQVRQIVRQSKPQFAAVKKAEEVSEKPLNPAAQPFVSQFPNDATDSDSCSDIDYPAPWGEIQLPPPPATKSLRHVERDQWRLKQRAKQIEIGQLTIGNKNLLRAQEIGFKHDIEIPKTPNLYQVCSKRAWDSQVRRWRQMLHKFDHLTEQLWSEEELKEIENQAAAHQKFKERVRKKEAKMTAKIQKQYEAAAAQFSQQPFLVPNADIPNWVLWEQFNELMRQQQHQQMPFQHHKEFHHFQLAGDAAPFVPQSVIEQEEKERQQQQQQQQQEEASQAKEMPTAQSTEVQ
eukprot:TRINITY_DN1382_c2_g2_i1.p1 TRINITY_DN1382_c2_g2~~TRINITY_DN1382_c2_g2_i1.p1  ORF type:complete len:373 (+),score=107.38 TRINITY_DN1382_c2_g2_i1:60-1121(+)